MTDIAPIGEERLHARRTVRMVRALVAWLCAALVVSSSALALTQRGHVYSAAASFGSEGTGAGQLKRPAGIAVNEKSGDVYVVDSANNRVERFDSAHHFVSAWGWGVADGSKQFEVCTSSCLPGIAGHAKGEMHGADAIAIDNSTSSTDPSAGDVYVEAITPYEEGEVEFEDTVIEKFTPSGELIDQIKGYKEKGSLFEDFEEPHGMTVGPTGTLWVYNEEDLIGFNNAEQNKFLALVESEVEGEPRSGLAVDSDGNFYVAHEEGSGEGAPAVIAKEDPVGEPIFEAIDPEDTSGVAVGTATKDSILDNRTSVAIFGPDASFIERFGGAGELVEGAGVTADSSTDDVLVADAATGKIQVFVPEPPGPPKIDELTVQNTSSSTTELLAQIDPTGSPTKYSFRYSTGSVPVAGEACTGGCVEVPLPTVEIGEGFSDVTKTQEVTDLTPATTYHYRVIATNAKGSAESGEQKFKTQLAVLGATLSDGRVWELVSPQDKNGAAIEGITREGGVIQAAEDGHAITYVASGAIKGAEGSRNPEYTQILSSRGPSEWSSRDLATKNEKGEGLITGSAPEYRFFSRDLGAELVQPFGEERFEAPPLSSETTERTVYLRRDAICQATPEACFTPLVTAANDEGETEFGGTKQKSQFGGSVKFITANPEADHVVLSSGVPLTKTPTKGQNLYEWAGGALQLVNVLTDGTPILGAELGVGNRIVTHAISDDGTRLIFKSTHLYMRDTTRAQTVQIDTPAAGVTEEPLRAHPVYQAASSDDSKVFFTDEEQLTPDSTAGLEKPDLYVCEVIENAGVLECSLTDLTVDSHAHEAADVQGVVPGAAEDGSSIYFVANGALSSAAKPGQCINEEEIRNKESGQTLGASCGLYVNRLNAATKTWSGPKLIATLSIEDEPNWGASGDHDLGNVTSRVSPDGNWLAFMSDRNLTGYNNRDAHSGKADEEVFLYNAATEALTCASCSPTGARPDGLLDIEESGEGIGLLVDRPLIWTHRWLAASLPGWTRLDLIHSLYQSHYLSNSGRLFFDSPEGLVPQDQNGKEDAYEFEPTGVAGCTTTSETYGEISGGCVSLISSGTSPKESAFLDASASGDDAFFVTAARLVTQDGDTSYDVYDAGVCGLPDTHECLPPPAASLPICQGIDECRPAPTATPSFAPPVSSNDSGSTNSGKHEVLGDKEEDKAKPKPLTRAQKYAKALKACKKAKSKHKRAVCVAQAKKKYGPLKKAKKSTSRGARH